MVKACLVMKKQSHTADLKSQRMLKHKIMGVTGAFH